MDSKQILIALTTQCPSKTCDLPNDQRGIYGLVDHTGALRYIGSTSGLHESFHKRIHRRHRTGSENYSHYFSKVYNCGRMWRDRIRQANESDAKVAKDLRSAFIAEYCRAVYVAIDAGKPVIEALEAEVISIAPRDCVLWNGSTTLTYPEPTELVDELIVRLGFSYEQRQAIDRQQMRCSGLMPV